MQLQLPTALEDFVRQQVATGRYRDESEVVSEALRFLEAGYDRAWDEMLAAIDEGDADISAGRSLTFDTVEELREHLSSL